MRKAEFLKHWMEMPASQEITPTSVPYKHEGKTFNEDGIRITGSRKFIDSVLSRLKDMLHFENGETRLQTIYQETKDKDSGEPTGSYSCYIQVHERGDEAKMANAFASALAKKPVIISKGY